MWQDGGNTRTKAIKWWNGMTIEDRRQHIETFKQLNPRYAEWDWQLIAMSTNMIELIYKTIVTC